MMLNKENKTITTLYELYKNSPKKLKIICDWDEVIQACEPYAAYLEAILRENKTMEKLDFTQYFRLFWHTLAVEYSSYGSKFASYSEEMNKKQTQIKNSPDFYQQAPFLTIAKDLLKLIKEDKIEKLIFLSTGDDRKKDVFCQTFLNLYLETDISPDKLFIDLKLLSEEMKIYPSIKTKANWIKERAPDFDLVIDDNPYICNSLIAKWFCKECINRQEKWFEENKGKSAFFVPCENCIPMRTVITPYYPAISKVATGIQEGYFSDVLFVKQEVVKIEKWEK